MSYYLLVGDKVIEEGDVVDIVFENGIVDFVADPKSSKNLAKVKISQIDAKLKSFYAFLTDYSSGIYIPVSGSDKVSIIEKNELNDPNIKFKHRSPQSWS